MDVRAIEALLAEVGKAVRLFRFYPPTHPSVQQAMTELNGVLPSLAEIGELELKIGPAGFVIGSTSVGARSQQVRELAALLYSQGHRVMLVEPGVTADEVAALVRVFAGTGKSGAVPGGGPAPQAPLITHLHLESVPSHGSSPGAKGQRTTTPRMVASPAPSLAPRSTGVFRPDALPPDIEARRLVALLEAATGAGALGSLTRLGAIAPEVAAARDYATLAAALAGMARWRGAAEPDVAAAAREGVARCVSEAAVGGLVGVLADPASPAREAAVAALGAVGEPALPALFDAYVAASDAAMRDRCVAAVRAVGRPALDFVRGRLSTVAGTEAQAAVELLGALEMPEAAGALSAAARGVDAGARRASLAALARMGAAAGPEGSRAAIAGLRDKDRGVRLAAAAAVAQLGDRGLGPIVAGRLHEETDDEVLRALVETLGALKDARAVGALADVAHGVRGVFQRRPPALRAAAVRALLKIGTPEALAAVEPYKTDRNAELRNAALEPPA